MRLEKNAYAKINLTLDVLGKRSDGYHNIISIMQTINLCDKVTLKKTNGGIDIAWSLQEPCDIHNTAYRAADLLFREYNLSGGLSVYIEKYIPLASGLGGGSADAAAVIEGIWELFNIKPDKQKMLELGTLIGADVPFCLTKGTAIAKGIGEKIVTIPERLCCYVVLVKPAVSISTKEAFVKIDTADLTRRFDADLAVKAIKASDFRNLGLNLFNVMELITVPEFPIVGKIKSKMITQGAQGALMSGSGPTVYGIFNNKALAENAYSYFKNSFKGDMPTEAFLSEFYYSPLE